jgi:hypothetical protein
MFVLNILFNIEIPTRIKLAASISGRLTNTNLYNLQEKLSSTNHNPGHHLLRVIKFCFLINFNRLDSIKYSSNEEKLPGCDLMGFAALFGATEI